MRLSKQQNMILFYNYLFPYFSQIVQAAFEAGEDNAEKMLLDITMTGELVPIRSMRELSMNRMVLLYFLLNFRTISAFKAVAWHNTERARIHRCHEGNGLCQFFFDFQNVMVE